MPGPLAVKRYMTTDPVVLRPEMSVLEAIAELVRHRISGAPVVDAVGDLVGLLTERDCMAVVLQTVYHGEPGGRVEEFMTREPETVDASASLMDVARRFSEKPFRRFPVLENGRLVGVIARRDVLRTVLDLATTSSG